MVQVFTGLSIGALAVMAFGLYSVLRLRSRIPGGAARTSWNALAGLVALFMAGYLLAPFFPRMDGELQLLVVGLIFLFGAVFVVVVIRLFERVVRDVGL